MQRLDIQDSAEPSTAPPSEARAQQFFLHEIGAAQFVAPVIFGGVDLLSLMRLSGSGRLVFECLMRGAPRSEVCQLLVRKGATSQNEAAADADRFIAELAHLGIDLDPGEESARLAPGKSGGRSEVEETTAESNRSSGSVTSAPVASAIGRPDAGVISGDSKLSASEVHELALAILARGLLLRFRARGRSMRPQIAHGEWVEAAPQPFESLRRGQVVLYRTGEHPLVAHRLLDSKGETRRARGDSCARIDTITALDYLGVAVRTARSLDLLKTGLGSFLDTSSRQRLGLLSGAIYGAGTGLFQFLIARPLGRRASRPSLVRSTLHFCARVISSVLLRLERCAALLRSPVDELRAALMSTVEKDEGRRRLYARRAVRGFTACDENLEAGLTLLEEAVLARHPLAKGGRVLVLGCGPGRECRALAERGLEVSGLDRDPQMLEVARQHLREHGVRADLVEGEAHSFEVASDPFDAVVVFSGLYNMILPSSRRVALLQCARRHLKPGGRVLLTFLSRYLEAADLLPSTARTRLEAINPQHEDGDRFLVNEAIHVFRHPDEVEREAKEADLNVVEIFRDQRAYDRFEGRVRGYAVLERP